MNYRPYHIFFNNFANPLKIRIILNLKDKEKSVNEIVKSLKIEQSKASHALASLKKCNLVKVKPEGRKRIYFLNKKTTLPILNIVEKHSNLFCQRKCENCRMKK